MDTKKRKCRIRGKEIAGRGNTPRPVKEGGECCRECNFKAAVPARMKNLKDKGLI